MAAYPIREHQISKHFSWPFYIVFLAKNLYIQAYNSLVNFTRAVCPCIFPPPKHQPSKFFTRSVLKSPISPQLYSLFYSLTLFLSQIFPLFCRGFNEITSLSRSLSLFSPLSYIVTPKSFFATKVEDFSFVFTVEENRLHSEVR